jgi:SAM-dependent methyltransferase
LNPRIPQDVLALYAGTPARVRGHVRVRWRSCPFAAVAARVPERGRILDYGCGHGAFAAWLAMLAPERAVEGVDVAAEKIAAAGSAARAAAAVRVPAARFRRIAPDEFPQGSWDAVLFVDVLYLLPPGEQERLLRVAARSLAPGGILLVKEVGERPRWKALWNRMQETIAVRVLRITQGGPLRILAPNLHAAWLESEGLEVESLSADRGYTHPHHLLAARRPVAPGMDRRKNG